MTEHVRRWPSWATPISQWPTRAAGGHDFATPCTRVRRGVDELRGAIADSGAGGSRASRHRAGRRLGAGSGRSRGPGAGPSRSARLMLADLNSLESGPAARGRPGHRRRRCRRHHAGARVRRHRPPGAAGRKRRSRRRRRHAGARPGGLSSAWPTSRWSRPGRGTSAAPPTCGPAGASRWTRSTCGRGPALGIAGLADRARRARAILPAGPAHGRRRALRVQSRATGPRPSARSTT